MRPEVAIAAACVWISGLASSQEPPVAPASESARFQTASREFAAEPLRPDDGAERRRDEIETDRDSFTPSVRTIDRKRLVIESAYTFFDNRGRAEGHSFPELITRYGLTDRLEFRLGWNYEVDGAPNTDAIGAAGEQRLERESAFNIGLKALVNEQRSWIPESSVILAALAPTSGEETATRFVGTYVFGWELSNRWKIDASLRYGADVIEGDHFADWAPSVVAKAPFGEKFSVHAEYFGLFTNGKERDDVRHYLSPGVHYLITPDFEVGVRLGWGLNEQSERFLVNVGVGYRF